LGIGHRRFGDSHGFRAGGCAVARKRSVPSFPDQSSPRAAPRHRVQSAVLRWRRSGTFGFPSAEPIGTVQLARCIWHAARILTSFRSSVIHAEASLGFPEGDWPVSPESGQSPSDALLARRRLPGFLNIECAAVAGWKGISQQPSFRASLRSSSWTSAGRRGARQAQQAMRPCAEPLEWLALREHRHTVDRYSSFSYNYVDLGVDGDLTA
jgi:hypothetical protein